MIKRVSLLPIMMCVAMVLVTCDDEPIEQSAPGSPTLTIGSTVKELDFSWNAVDGASYYRLYENPDGVSSFAQLGSDLTDLSYTKEIAVHRFEWAAARYKVEACNDVGCTASSEISAADTMLSAIGYVKASNTDPFDNFGKSLALSGDGYTLAVGAPDEDSNSTGIEDVNTASNAGAVYVYARSGSTWAKQAYVKASNVQQGDAFGWSVALSEDGATLAVGAYTEDGNGIDGPTNNGAASAGAVYVFTRSGSAWTQQAYVKASNAGPEDQFGRSVVLSGDGNTLVAGAPGESSNATYFNGPDNELSESSGAVYVFTRSGSAWTQQVYVKASNTGLEDQFGLSVALSENGDTLAVGTSDEDSSATGIGGDPFNSSAPDSGAVYVYKRVGGVWSTMEAYMKPSNTGAGDRFGCSLSLSADGNILAVGSYVEGSVAVGIDGDQGDVTAGLGAGAAYVFTRSGSVWAQEDYVKASNTGQTDHFGSSVCLSADGNALAVGANHEDSDATNVGGDQTRNFDDDSGAVYLY